MMPPQHTQGPPGLPSVPGFCSPASLPSLPAKLDRGQQLPRAGPGGDQGPRRHLSNSKCLSISSPQLLIHNQFSDPRVSKSGHRTLLGSIPVKAIGFQKHQVPTLLAKQPLYKGGSEPAENHIPVSCCLKLFSSLNVIMQAQCPWTTTHGRVVHGKTCLRKISSNSAHLKISLRKKKMPWVFPLTRVWFQLLPLRSHFWLEWGLP